MGLRDEAEKSIKDQRAAAAEVEATGRDETIASVPDALQRWCREALDADGPASFTLLRISASQASVEFQLEDIAFSGDVIRHNGDARGGVVNVRVKTDGMFPGPVVSDKQSLAEALAFHARF